MSWFKKNFLITLKAGLRIRVDLTWIRQNLNIKVNSVIWNMDAQTGSESDSEAEYLRYTDPEPTKITRIRIQIRNIH